MSDFYQQRKHMILSGDNRYLSQILDMDRQLEDMIKEAGSNFEKLSNLIRQRRPLVAGRIAAQEAFDEGLSIDEILEIAIEEINKQAEYWGVVA
jgi:hypothetical protein